MSDSKSFLGALRGFHHSVGWMLKLQDDLAAITAKRDKLRAAFFDPHELRDQAGALVEDLTHAWAEVRERKRSLKDAFILPAHPIEGASPLEWRHQLLCEVDEALELVGGPHANAPKLTVGERDREKLIAVLAQLSARTRQPENMIAAIPDDVKPPPRAEDPRPIATQLRDAYVQHGRAHLAVLVLMPPFSGPVPMRPSVLSPDEVNDGFSRSHGLGHLWLNDGSRVGFVLRYDRSAEEAATAFETLAAAAGAQIPRSHLARLEIMREGTPAATWCRMLVKSAPEYIESDTGNYRVPDPTKAFQIRNPFGASLRAWESGFTQASVAPVSAAGDGILGNAAPRPRGRARGSKVQPRFLVSLSFPGEHRCYVEQVDAALCERLKPVEVFYDNRFKHELARPDLDTHLQRIYHADTKLLVVFLCQKYEQKQWCRLEWRAIRDVIKKRREQDVMFFRFDDADVAGVFSIDGYIDARTHTPQQAADLIARRLADPK